MEEKYLISKEDIKTLSGKVIFKNKFIELVDDPTFSIINNLVLNKLAEKIPDEVLSVIQPALSEIINDMDEVEI